MGTLDALTSKLDREVDTVDVLTSRTAARKVDQARSVRDQLSALVDSLEDADAGQMQKSAQTVDARRQLDQAEQDLAAATAAAERTRVTLHLAQLGNRFWKRLLWLIPPTAEQQARMGRKLDHNPEVFPVVAVAFSLVDVDEHGKVTGPAVDQDDLDGLLAALEKAGGDPARAARTVDDHLPPAIVTLNERLTPGGWDQLTGKLYQLNLEVSQVPLSLRGSAETDGS